MPVRSLALGIAALLLGCSFGGSVDPDIEKLGRATGPVAPAGRIADRPVADPAGQGSRLWRGKVLETIDVPNYTYIKLAAQTGEEVWTAVPRDEVAVGAEVAIVESIVMTNFTSRALGRTFPSIVFGVLEGRNSPPTGPGTTPPPSGSGMPGLPLGHPPVGDEAMPAAPALPAPMPNES